MRDPRNRELCRAVEIRIRIATPVTATRYLKGDRHSVGGIRQRRCMSRCVFYQYTHAEVAASTSIPRSAIINSISRYERGNRW